MSCYRWIISGMVLGWLILLPIPSLGLTMEEEIKLLKARIELLEKKLVEKSELDILRAEQSQTREIVAKLDHLEKDIHDLKGDHHRGI